MSEPPARRADDDENNEEIQEDLYDYISGAVSDGHQTSGFQIKERPS
jgi:hypothetical protein